MTEYSIPGDAEELFPESGFAVVVMDEFKPPDSDDFINILSTFDTAEDVILPPERSGYTYSVHASNGEAYSREEWPPDQ